MGCVLEKQSESVKIPTKNNESVFYSDDFANSKSEVSTAKIIGALVLIFSSRYLRLGDVHNQQPLQPR